MIDADAGTWSQIALFVAVGFLAQIVDGALGMAYKIITSAVLLSLGLPPAAVSASVHAAGTFTSVASGLAHWKLGNVDRKLMLRLLVPGAIGGFLGAMVLAKVAGSVLRPWISGYLILMGAYILWRALKTPARIESTGIPRATPAVGFLGGFFDAVGGGGWGPIVTTTLLGSGIPPRAAIGSVNAAEFFVTIVIAGTLLGTVGISLWPIIAALVTGGMIAAPFAALLTRHMHERTLMVAVAAVILLVSGRTLLSVLS